MTDNTPKKAEDMPPEELMRHYICHGLNAGDSSGGEILARLRERDAAKKKANDIRKVMGTHATHAGYVLERERHQTCDDILAAMRDAHSAPDAVEKESHE